MKKVKTLAAVAALGMAVNAASAALLVADGFNYPTGGLSGNADVDYPTNPATWAYAGAAAQMPGPVVVAGNTTYTGPGALPAFPGSNSGEFTAADNGTARIQLTSPPTAFSQAANAGTSLYYSFTMSVSDISKLSSGTGGAFAAGFNNSVGPQTSAPSAYAGVLCMNRDSSSATTFHLGVAQQQATGRTFIANQYSLNDPLFVVVAYNFGATPGTDTSDLYVFDSANGDAIPVSLPASPTAHGAYTAEINTGVDSISSFSLRDNTGAMTAALDDLRIGTSWSDVATVPEPASIGLLGIGAVGLLGRRRKPK